jgi:hypothetical protein
MSLAKNYYVNIVQSLSVQHLPLAKRSGIAILMLMFRKDVLLLAMTYNAAAHCQMLLDFNRILTGSRLLAPS